MALAATYRIREAGPDDAHALAVLRWEFSDEEKRNEGFDRFVSRFERFWLSALRDGRWTVFVADRGGVLVSNMWIYSVPRVPRPQPQADTYGYLTNVYTVPGVRNTGVGAAILTRVIEWAREKGLEGIIVSPSDESVPFYERAGFTWSDQWLEIMFDE